MKILPKSAPAAALAALAFSAVAMPALAHDHAVKRGRLAFSDHTKPVVQVLDLDTGEVTHSFAVPLANPVLTGTQGGRYVVIKTGDDAGTVRFLDMGLSYDNHGDHLDIEKGDVSLLDFNVTGDKPAHVVSGHGQLALFYDGQRPWERKSEPRAVLIRLKSLADKAPSVTVWSSPAPQHGIAVPLGKRQWLMSLPNPVYAKGEDRSASSRPDGFEIVEQGKTWKALASFNDPSRADASCKLFHGHSVVKNAQIFGCAEGEGGGILVVAPQGKDNWGTRKLAYPDDRRTSSVKSGKDAAIAVGNYGLKGPYNAFLRIDPKAKALTLDDVMVIPGGQASCRFELNSDGSRLANLTADGKLRVYDVAPAWREVASFDAVPGFDCQFGAKTPTPALAVIGGSAFVSDPVNGRIREYHLGTLKQGLDMPVGGAPSALTGAGDPD